MSVLTTGKDATIVLILCNAWVANGCFVVSWLGTHILHDCWKLFSWMKNSVTKGLYRNESLSFKRDPMCLLFIKCTWQTFVPSDMIGSTDDECKALIHSKQISNANNKIRKCCWNWRGLFLEFMDWVYFYYHSFYIPCWIHVLPSTPLAPSQAHGKTGKTRRDLSTPYWFKWQSDWEKSCIKTYQ